MTDPISAQEWELLSFFEVEPELQDDAPWTYNDALYRIERGDIVLTFAVAPSYRDIRLVLTRGEQCLFELNAQGIRDVRYSNENGVESLTMLIDQDARSEIVLCLQPEVRINQKYC